MGSPSANASPSLRALPVAHATTASRPPKPVPRHAFLRVGHAVPAHPRSLPRTPRPRVSQCHKVDDGIAIGEAALAEPCAVTLHAVDRAGSLLDKRVLVTGCGPIGALAIIAARAYGAREIVATDVSETIPGFAGRIGADRTINVATNPEALAAYGANKGSFDV